MRQPTAADLEAYLAWFADPEMTAFFGGGELPSSDRVEAMLRDRVEQFDPARPAMMTIVWRANGAAIGQGGYQRWEIDREIVMEIAGVVARPWWGQGLATEAAIALRDYAFTTLEEPRLVLLTHPDNHRAIRVAERLGAKHWRRWDPRGGRGVAYLLERNR